MKKPHGKIPRRTRDLNLLGGAVWILPGVAKILATLLSTGAFATDERGMARVLMLSCILQRARWRRARTSCVFLSHNAARAARRPTGDPQITPSNRSRTHYDSNSTNRRKFTQTRRQTDTHSRNHQSISYKQRRKSYKIPDFHTNMTDFITFK